MEQTSTMDKKPQLRSTPPLCKSNQDPSKTGFDFSTKKSGAQYARKRENEKYDNYKRSSNRGGRSGQRYVRPREKVGCQVDGKDSTSEIGSLQWSGSKKHNITHLLNWWGPGPERTFRGFSNDYTTSRGYKSRKHGAQMIKYSKEHYIHTNCQFVVASGHDYSLYDNDPDQPVDWKLVEEIRLHLTEAPACPICLHPPIAAKVTRCGHVYCFACMLHYLALTDEDWRKCPICFDTVTIDDLKSVIYILHKDISTNQVIELKLMRRERECLTPVPVTSFSPSLTNVPASLSCPDARLSYSKLIMASKAEVSKFIVGREIEALECQLAIEGDQPEACFIKDALNLASERNLILKIEDETSVASSAGVGVSLPEHAVPRAMATLRETFDKVTIENVQGDEKFESCDEGDKNIAKLDNSLATDAQNIRPEDLDIGQLQESSSDLDLKGCPKSTFYFYQESGGAHLYLHALNVHMLVREYGCLEKCPQVITAKILEKESDSMTGALRQRLRYLRHLPVNCPFEVVEIEMKPPLISQLTVAEYQGQLEQRERKRKKRAKEEHRIEMRVQVEEDRLMGRSKGSKINMTSFKHFPVFTEEPIPSFVEESTVVATTSNSNTNDFPNLSPPSFAQMIRCGQKKPSCVIANTSATHSNVLPDNRFNNAGTSRKSMSSDDECEEAERVPAYKTAFSDAFAIAFDRALNSEGSTTTAQPRGKKGKKKKGIVLLSSGGR